EVETAPPEPAPVAYVGVGYAPYWWWDPWWPHATFVHVRPVYVGMHGHVVVGPHGGFHHVYAHPHTIRGGGHYTPHVQARPPRLRAHGLRERRNRRIVRRVSSGEMAPILRARDLQPSPLEHPALERTAPRDRSSLRPIVRVRQPAVRARSRRSP